MKYQEIINLIQQYEVFKTQNPQGTQQEFGFWLANLETQEIKNEDNQAVETPENERDIKTLLSYHEDQPLEGQIGIMLARMFKYVRYYTKKSYGQDLNFTLEEFGILAGADHFQNPTKSELIAAGLIETTTGTEIIKRLTKLGYLETLDNETDKRSKRVKITKKGRAILMILYERMSQISHLACANLSQKQKIDLLQILIYLNDFHLKNYFEHRDMSIEEMLNLFINN